MIEEALGQSLQDGPLRIGQIVLRRAASGGYDCNHLDDEGNSPTHLFNGAAAAREIVRFSREGAFRPLKGAPNLVDGWRLHLATLPELRQTLDYFYPGAFATFLAFRAGQVRPVPLRDTLQRQTGMYRVTQKLTNDQANRLVGSFCQSETGCLRTILWKLDQTTSITSLPCRKSDPDHNQTGRPEPAVPFFCVEACNLLVAEARKMVKAAPG